MVLSYHGSSRDAYLIEVPSTVTMSGEEVEKWSQGLSDSFDRFDIASRFWYLQEEGGRDRRLINLEKNPFEICKKFFWLNYNQFK